MCNKLEAREKALKIALGMGDMGNLEKNAKRFEKYLLRGDELKEPPHIVVGHPICCPQMICGWLETPPSFADFSERPSSVTEDGEMPIWRGVMTARLYV